MNDFCGMQKGRVHSTVVQSATACARMSVKRNYAWEKVELPLLGMFKKPFLICMQEIHTAKKNNRSAL